MAQTVPEFYEGQKILLTGGSGFMGKVLLEKMLRSCPELDTIYLIIRPKKGKSVEERWKYISQLPLFDKLKSMRPNNLDKVKLIPGELSREDLGISEEDKQVLIENVTLVFHFAADVQFSESLINAIEQNVKATKDFLDFVKTFKQVKAFVYVSTAFSNFNRPASESVEKIFPSCQDWRTLLKLHKSEPITLQLLKEKLLCGHPNPYTWSKSLAEQIVSEYSNNFPTVVFRPAIVMGCHMDDPLKGWVDTMNGVHSLGIGIFTGILRILNSKEDDFTDYISVDYASRAMLIAAKKASEQGTKLDVYNAASAEISTFTTKDLLIAAYELEKKYPIPQQVWPVSVVLTANPFLYHILFILRQVLPSLFMDMCLKIAGHEPVFKMLAIRAANGNRLFGKFSASKTKFPIENYKNLEGYLSENDKADFSIHVRKEDVDTQQIIVDMSVGVLKYVFSTKFNLNLSEESLKKNRKRFEKIKLLRKAVKTVQYSIYGLILWKCSSAFIY